MRASNCILVLKELFRTVHLGNLGDNSIIKALKAEFVSIRTDLPLWVLFKANRVILNIELLTQDKEISGLQFFLTHWIQKACWSITVIVRKDRLLKLFKKKHLKHLTIKTTLPSLGLTKLFKPLASLELIVWLSDMHASDIW